MALLLLLVEVIGMGVNTANVLASALVMGLNYLLTITFVFERGRHAPWKEVAGFFVFAILGYLLNIWLMYLLTAQVPIHYTLAKTLVVGGVAGFNFVTRKFFIFKG
jgi:putative flippase GtrA